MGKQGLAAYSGLQKCIEIRGRGGKNGKVGPVHLRGARKMHRNPWEGWPKWESGACGCGWDGCGCGWLWLWLAVTGFGCGWL
jgi:hypothetical protein